MNSDRIREDIEQGAAELRRLQNEVKESFRNRGKGESGIEHWQRAATEFRARYDSLAFPGGELTLKRRLFEEDPYALECAVCFLEVRPFFFRSGYMFRDLLRWCNKLPLTPEQRKRYDRVKSAYVQWREGKNLKGETRHAHRQSDSAQA